MDGRVRSLVTRMSGAVREMVVVDGETAYIPDPVFGIIRNRVHAEVAKTLLRTGDDPLAEPLLNYIVQCQNPEGSWNEVHVNYNQPSALITAFIGDALLEAADRYPHEEALESARDYVIAAEKRPGYFLKSAQYTADHVNVDASCGAFLARYAERYDDRDARAAAVRAAENVVRHQRDDGVYPYAVDRGTYPYTFDLPCAHYQGVTLYYLAKVNDVLKERWIRESLTEGVRWLAVILCPRGQFDWSESGLSFAYHLSGAYAFAHASFIHASRGNGHYLEHAGLCFCRLEEIVRGGLHSGGSRNPGTACPHRSPMQRGWHRSGSFRHDTGRSGSATRSTGRSPGGGIARPLRRDRFGFSAGCSGSRHRPWNLRRTFPISS